MGCASRSERSIGKNSVCLGTGWWVPPSYSASRADSKTHRKRPPGPRRSLQRDGRRERLSGPSHCLLAIPVSHHRPPRCTWRWRKSAPGCRACSGESHFVIQEPCIPPFSAPTANGWLLAMTLARIWDVNIPLPIGESSGWINEARSRFPQDRIVDLAIRYERWRRSNTFEQDGTRIVRAIDVQTESRTQDARRAC